MKAEFLTLMFNRLKAKAAMDTAKGNFEAADALLGAAEKAAGAKGVMQDSAVYREWTSTAHIYCKAMSHYGNLL